MKMPGLTAEASLYESSRQYRMGMAGDSANTRIVPQSDRSDCGDCSCEDGQCCSKTWTGGCKCKTC